ncbi:MAG: ABC transporter ATP-binding protein [Actinomycetes bacterium]|nr:ABC transporter ATP-binding protein [Actinomycetes bacterium]MDX5381176.1 ABC transporter ATP-binding protein [Actinomycetes bacterium]MDX5400460.1 ABC transporter ATP-binding protein [Actinomycetes bacterium]MDX5450943.1 ABC transporter ATP-binding protein [Actinomycetes bacterium]
MTSTTPAGLEIRGLTHRFGSVTALDDVTVDVRPVTFTGLVGRNGAGKTTLAALVAALRPVQSGSILLDGADPWEDPVVTSRTCLVRDKGGVVEDERIRTTFEFAAMLRPNWDGDYARELLDRFEIPFRRKPQQLSTGKRSALRAVLGLASRSDLTIFDEVYLGMDAVARRMFYDELMADWIAHPRTIILSSHLLDEVEDLMEDVIVLDRGRLAAAGDADEIRRRHSSPRADASLTDVLIALSTPASRSAR